MQGIFYIVVDFSFNLLDNIFGDINDKFYTKNNRRDNHAIRSYWRYYLWQVFFF